MKKMRSLLVFSLVLSLLFGSMPLWAYAASKTLITINDKSVTSDMTVSDVSALFGEPKLSTPSAFGGQACTFYGDAYADYLYIETNAVGSIVSYATFTPAFTTDKKSYGDLEGNFVFYMQGTVASDYNTDEIWAGCFYNFTGTDIAAYKENWNADTETYRRGLLQHSALMFNGVSSVIGGWSDVNVQFDETVFLTNEQLEANGSDLYAYGGATGKNAYVRLVSKGSDSFMNYSHLPNPLQFAKYGKNYHINGNATAVAFYASIDSSPKCDVYFVDPAILDQGEFVSMTAQETVQLKAAREEYAASVAAFNSAAAGGYFETPYQFETLPLEAGKMKDGILEGTLGYLNAIRVGAGLPKLTLSYDLCNSAQHKAVLTMYMAANDIANPNPHYPAKPDGVSDAFYALCNTYSGENLYNNSILGGDFVIGSVQNALQEAYGDVIACGHRYNLLDPNWKEIGFGSCNGQGVHQMKGYQACDEDMVAWPSKGIMLVDANRESYRWTMLFCNGSYRLTDSTTVTITNLNTKKTWTEQAGVSDFQTIGNSEISFYDADIAYTIGDICEITIDGLLKDGQPASYSYRTVFASVSGESAEENTSITLSDSALSLKTNTTALLHASLSDSTLKNQLLRFSSTDESVATVLPNGRIVAKGVGKAVILVTADVDSTVFEQCTVTVYDPIGDLNSDGEKNMQDVYLLFYYVAGAGTLSDEQLSFADLNADGGIDLVDAYLLYRHVAGFVG